MALAGCTGTTTTTVLAPASSPPGTLASAPPLAQVHDPDTVTGTLEGKTCRATGTPPYELPDPACTPGSFDPSITAAVLCMAGYTTASYRPPSSATTRFKYGQAYPAYGIPATEPTELDHLVSLELGGSNDATNLWPEPLLSPNPKDGIENRLHAWVCAPGLPAAQASGRLQAAQLAIAHDWVTALEILGVPGAPPLPSAPAAGNSDDLPSSPSPSPARSSTMDPHLTAAALLMAAEPSDRGAGRLA